jgi:hypothetical protein
MEVLVKVVDPVRVEGAGTADEAVNRIALIQQKLRQIRSILARNSCDERCLHKVPFRTESGDPILDYRFLINISIR